MIDIDREEAAHGEAIDLVFDSLDFQLSFTEQRRLDEHLAQCEDCRDEAALIRGDDDLLEHGFDWATADDVEDFGPPPPRPPDEDLDDFFDERDEPTVSVFDATDIDRLPSGSVHEAAENEVMLGNPAIDDDDVPPPSSTRRGGDDAEGADSSESDEESDDGESDDDDLEGDADGEPDGDADGEAGDDRPDKAGGRSSSADGDADDEDADAADDDEADEADRQEAEAEAEAMTDADLGDVESEKVLAEDDELFDSCIDKMVEDAAREHGAPTGDDIHKSAERAVRSRDGLQRTDFGTVAVYRSAKGLRERRSSYHVDPRPSPQAAAAVRNAILRSRLGRAGVERRQPRGRLDSMSLHRIAEHDHKLFKRPIVPSPGKFLVWVMVDVSGSMDGYPVADAATVARALADATVGTPTVRMAVWGWSDPFLRGYGSLGWSASAGVVKVWEKGRSSSTEDIYDLTRLRMGSTPDAPVLAWAWREILKQLQPGERPAIIMCSDGWGDSRLPLVIEQATKHGVAVKSVALGSYVAESDQLFRFGRGNYVPWRGSINETARPLATMVAKMAAGE